jgi:2-keto-4-pentenoate hydratase/2-oxohepta-3-ene-1,7-dioic acid hydratase in catechol pathway
MLFGIEELISAASQGMTLHPGDVILTGTPAGVGLADGRYLNPGDTVTVAIEGLGQLENHVTGAS